MYKIEENDSTYAMMEKKANYYKRSRDLHLSLFLIMLIGFLVALFVPYIKKDQCLYTAKQINEATTFSNHKFAGKNNIAIFD